MSELQSLVNRCLADEPGAMVQLINRFRGRVFALCYRMLGQRQDAEDAVQETFLRVVRHLASWDRGRAFEPWLLTIAANRCRSLLARRRQRPAPEPLVELVPDERQCQSVRQRHLAEEVARALEDIRVEYRQAFVLFHFHGLSYAEIGRTLQCPLGTVKTWVHRGRRELRARLEKRQVV